MKNITLCLFFILGTLSFTQDNFQGYWMMPDGNFIIKIYKANQEVYRGRVVWLKNPTYPQGDKDEGKIQVDRNNPDKSLRLRPILGLQIVGGLRFDGKKLKDGWVYDSWHGKKYYGRGELKGENLLKLKGSMDKFGIFGYTLKASRVKEEDLINYGIRNNKETSQP